MTYTVHSKSGHCIAVIRMQTQQSELTLDDPVPADGYSYANDKGSQHSQRVRHRVVPHVEQGEPTRRAEKEEATLQMNG